MRCLPFLLIVVLGCAGVLRAQAPTTEQNAPLPRFVTEGWDFSVWGWLGYNYVNPSDQSSQWVSQVGLGVTKSFNQRIAATVEVEFTDWNNDTKVELQQGFVSILLSENHQTLLTAGRFVANFGVEPRNFWDRLSGTTSLLFGAQPQELTGVMLTQPLGDTGLKLRPFLVSSFQTHNVPDSPSVGLTLEYSPHETFTAAVTNWYGPGFVWGNPGSGWTYWDSPTENWGGPSIDGANGGSLYFIEVMAIWRPRPQWTIEGEYLFASNNSSQGHYEWDGAMALVNYDIDDRWRVFGMWSFLNDPDWLVLGEPDRRNQISVGFGYQLYRGIEVRGEYRHDFSAAGQDQNVVSMNLSFSY